MHAASIIDNWLLILLIIIRRGITPLLFKDIPITFEKLSKMVKFSSVENSYTLCVGGSLENNIVIGPVECLDADVVGYPEFHLEVSDNLRCFRSGRSRRI